MNGDAMKSTPRERNIWAWSLVVWYVLLTWTPVALILYLSNDWYYVVLKVISCLFFVSICANLMMSQPTINFIGSAGFGFVAAAVAFWGFCWLTHPWAKIALGFFIVTILGTCKMIMAGGGVERVAATPESTGDEEEVN